MTEISKPSLVPFSNGDRDVLSDELKQNFIRLRNFANIDEERESKRRKCDKPDIHHSNERFQLAMCTMAMAESEINKLKNGIAELEALLEEEDDEECDDYTEQENVHTGQQDECLEPENICTEEAKRDYIEVVKGKSDG